MHTAPIATGLLLGELDREKEPGPLARDPKKKSIRANLSFRTTLKFLFYGSVLNAVLLILTQLCALFCRQQCTCVQTSKKHGVFLLMYARGLTLNVVSIQEKL